MFSEQLAVMLILASAQVSAPRPKAPANPFVEDARHAVIRAVKEPELVAALSLRAKRSGMRMQPARGGETMLAWAN